MAFPLDDTIAAIASPPGGGARGILRLSGPNVVFCLRVLFEPDSTYSLESISRPTAIPGVIAIADQGPRLPCELYLWPDRRSYTGQPAAEIHTLGSPPLLESVLATLLRSGARLAEPGEFTLRAFLCGRLDLTQAEAVLGVIDAANDRQFQVAVAQLAGGLAGPLTDLRNTLLDLLAHLEAGFDFADEDLPFITADELDRQLASACETVSKLVRQMTSRSESTRLARVVLTGWPNVGKSSLFNALAAGTGALVSELAGTTRDYLTAEMDVDGAKFVLVDTAGADSELAKEDATHRAAQAAAAEQADTAHLRLLCIDSTRPLNAWEQESLRSGGRDTLVVVTKCDAVGKTDYSGQAVVTSSVSDMGIDRLRWRIRQAVLAARTSEPDVVAGTAVRCRESLRVAANCLDRAGALVRTGRGEELVAAEVRFALDELGKVVGAVYTDDVLDRIFSRFCIGK
jgi:tRNA modification GTPase